MPSVWIDTDHRVSLSANLLEDLDIGRFGQYFLKMDFSEIAPWFEKYLTSDAGEMARRSSIVRALFDAPGAADKCRLIQRSLSELRAAVSEAKRAQRPLAYCTANLRLIRLYISGAREACEALSGLPALAEISAFIARRLASPAFAAVARCENEVSAVFKPLASVTVRVGVLENGDGFAFRIADIADEDAPSVSFLGESALPADSLLPPARVNNRNEVVHLESFLLTHVERQWRGRLSQARKLLAQALLDDIDEWLEAMAPVDFYVSALAFAEKVAAAGCPLCAPTASERGFDFDELYCPHFALERPSHPYSQSLDARATTLITGANHAGKTTFLKSVAQSCLLAQLGFLIPAKSFAFPLAASMRTVFAAGEGAGISQSRFEKELTGMREAVANADERAMVWINEPYTSTNPEEAVSLLGDALRGLRRKSAIHWCVTHLYGVYGSLAADSLPPQSLVVERAGESDDATAIRISLKPPDFLSSAREIARQFGVSAASFLRDEALLRRVETYLSEEASKC